MARLSCLHTCGHGAHGVVVSHPLSMREAPGSIPGVSIFSVCDRERPANPPRLVASQKARHKRCRQFCRSAIAAKTTLVGFEPIRETPSALGRRFNFAATMSLAPRQFRTISKAFDKTWAAMQSTSQPALRRGCVCHGGVPCFFRQRHSPLCDQPLSIHGTSGPVAATWARCLASGWLPWPRIPSPRCRIVASCE